MIIFDLDTLADDTHRRHFIEPSINHLRSVKYDGKYANILTGELWQPDYEAYNAACGDDVPIKYTITILSQFIIYSNYNVEIWSVRCESLKSITLKWLYENWFFNMFTIDIKRLDKCIKMRPIGNSDPAHVLKEKWLEDTLIETKWGNKYSIDFVFDSDPESIAMWKRRGVYCFDCRQG